MYQEYEATRFHVIRQMWMVRFSFHSYATAVFKPRRCPVTQLLVGSSPGTYCGPRDNINENIEEYRREPKTRTTGRGAVLQPTAATRAPYCQ